MGLTTVQRSVLASTDQEALPVTAVTAILNAVREIVNDEFQQSEPVIITQASSLSQLPMDSSSIDIVVSIWSSLEFLSNQFLSEVFRVMKPDGTILIYRTSQSATGQSDKAASSLEHKLLMAGFLETQSINTNSVVSSEVVLSFGIKAKKASWDIGSSFSIKKTAKTLPKIQIDDDMDLIDEDSLLTEEDLKKPQLPPAGDCEVGSTKKACKNCTCGRAEVEKKLVKLGPTTDQLNNPQSACGSCGLGDAFRCSTCPYRGLPVFKLGEKVSMPTDFFTADL